MLGGSGFSFNETRTKRIGQEYFSVVARGASVHTVSASTAFGSAALQCEVQPLHCGQSHLCQDTVTQPLGPPPEWQGFHPGVSGIPELRKWCSGFGGQGPLFSQPSLFPLCSSPLPGAMDD